MILMSTVYSGLNIVVHAGANPAFNSSFNIFLKRLPGVGSEPGSSHFIYIFIFHHFTAEPQRLPNFNIVVALCVSKRSNLFHAVCVPYFKTLPL
jgi:hypothetical protein